MRRPREILVVLLILGIAACRPTVDLPREQLPPPEPPDPNAIESPSITVSPSTAAPGEEVRVEATGMPALADVVIGFGPPESEYEVLARYATDADGLISETVAVPDWAAAGRAYVWVVATPDNDVRLVSAEFSVQSDSSVNPGDPDTGTIRVEGAMTGEGVECPALRTDDGTLYTLAGAPDDLSPGELVVVTGTVAEMSFCQQGTTISVQSVQRR